jgi:N4-gp56 family major capsid protein
MKTVYGVNDAEAVKLWSKKLDHEVLKKVHYKDFMGMGSDSLVQIKNDLTKSPGDRIRTILRMQLTGRGVQEESLEGKEERLATYTDDIIINELAWAVRSGGRMTEQRIPFSVREEARMGLEDWFAGRLDTWFFNQISGNSSVSDTIYTGNQSVSAPDSDHHIFANSKGAESSLSVGDTFSLAYVDQCVLKARTLDVPIRPCKTGVPGTQYVMFITPEMHYDLRRNTSTGDYYDIQLAAIQGGNYKDNPLITGAIGAYNNTLLVEAFRLPVGTLSNDSNSQANARGRAVFCGAQAACKAYGRTGSGGRYAWVEEFFDYKRELGVSAALVGGLKKTRYNSEDFATIVVSTAHSVAASSAAGR